MSIAVRSSFPVLNQEIDGRQLRYLDAAATSPATQDCLDAMQAFETTARGNVHRGMHVLSDRATTLYEDARKTVANFVGASSDEIVFTKNCTEALNTVARSFGSTLSPGDCIALSILEHHSNIVPWQQLAVERGIEIVWIGLTKTGEIDIDSLADILSKHPVKMVSVSALSNVLGSRTNLEAVVQLAHDAGARVCIDAAQFVAHHKIDVSTLDCDFLCFSGHKLYGPTGVGVLYAKRDHLEALPAFLGGGMMIGEVTKHGFTPGDIPQKFEAGTPPIAQAIGLAASIEWLQQFAWEDIESYEASLMQSLFDVLCSIDGLHILGSTNPNNHSGVVSFVVDGVHPHDLTDILGQKGICMRAGHHCCQPLHDEFGIPASTRVSIGLYNTADDFATLQEEIGKVEQILS